MDIINKWAIRDWQGKYFVKTDGEQLITAELSNNTRLYDSKRAAASAIKRISEICGEVAADSRLVPEYIENKTVPDAEPHDSPPIIDDTRGWSAVDSFGNKVHYLRRETPQNANASGSPRFEYAVCCIDGKLRGFGTDELSAWEWYSDYRKEVGSNRIKSRSGDV